MLFLVNCILNNFTLQNSKFFNSINILLGFMLEIITQIPDIVLVNSGTDTSPHFIIQSVADGERKTYDKDTLRRLYGVNLDMVPDFFRETVAVSKSGDIELWASISNLLVQNGKEPSRSPEPIIANEGKKQEYARLLNEKLDELGIPYLPEHIRLLALSMSRFEDYKELDLYPEYSLLKAQERLDISIGSSYADVANLFLLRASNPSNTNREADLENAVKLYDLASGIELSSLEQGTSGNGILPPTPTITKGRARLYKSFAEMARGYLEVLSCIEPIEIARETPF